MAEELSRGHESVFQNYKISKVNQPHRCNSCFKYKSELEEMAVELRTARKIIQLLQEDLHTYKDPTPTSTSGVRSKSHGNSKLTTNWETITVKSRKPSRLAHDLQPIPEIPISNRYNILHNLQNDVEPPSNLQNPRSKWNASPKQNNTSSSPGKKKKRILLIGDSHMRGCASELRKHLGPEYEVAGTVMPGSRLQNVTKLASNEIEGLSHNDAVVIWGGANDINRNESMEGLKHLTDFVDHRKNTNVMIVPAPHRHDLPFTSCVNKEVQNFNRKLRKIMKNKVNVRLLEQETNREDFTKHGLHLNATGKEKVVKVMSLNISQILETKMKHPVILKWRPTHSDPSPVNSALNVTNEDRVVIDNKRRKEDPMELGYLVDQRGSQTLEVMIFYGYKV